MITPKRKQTTALLAIVSVLGSILIIVAAIVPGVQRVLTVRQQDEELKQTAATLTSKVAVLQGTNETNLENQLKTALAALPIVAPYQQTLALLFSLLPAYNLGIIDLKFLSAQGDGAAVDVILTTSGDYDSLKTFVSKLNTSIPLVTTHGVKLTRKVESDEYTAEIALRVQQAPAPKTIGKVSDPLPPISADFEKTLTALQSSQSFGLQTSQTESGGAASAATLFAP